MFKNLDDEVNYELTLIIDPKYLEKYMKINPNFLDSLGNVKKYLLDRPFESFTQLSDENDSLSVSRSKSINQSIKKDFYLSRKMAGIEYPSGLVLLRIVFD